MIKAIFPLLTGLILPLLAVPVLLAQDSEVTARAYQTVNLRSGPGTQYEIVGQLEAEDEVPALGRDTTNRWLQVGLPDSDDSGWLAIFTVSIDGSLELLPRINAETPTDTSSEGPSIISYGRVNVRSGPGVEYDIIAQLEVDDEANIIARNNFNNDWLYIENEAIAGWVAYFTVSVFGSLDEMPVRVTDEATGDLIPPSMLVSANYNIRLHSSPSFRARVLTVIPFQTDVNPSGISADGEWLYLSYNNRSGWALARLFDLSDAQRAQIPLRRAALR